VGWGRERHIGARNMLLPPAVSLPQGAMMAQHGMFPFSYLYSPAAAAAAAASAPMRAAGAQSGPVFYPPAGGACGEQCGRVAC
jgi:hypothetical protein